MPEAPILERVEPWKRRRPRKHFRLKSGHGRFGWCRSIGPNTRRNGRRSHRLRIDLLTGTVHARVEEAPPLARVHRVPRRSLSYIHHDPGDPRQSFRPHVAGDAAWLETRPEGRFDFVFTPNTAPRSTSSRASSPSSPARCCATSGSPPSRSSRTVSSPPSTTSTSSPWCIPGPTSPTKPLDMIRILGTVY